MCSRTVFPASVAAFAAVSLLAAGCGGSSTTVATTTTPTANGALAYAHCMRSHGVPNFPDPATSEGNDKEAVVRVLQGVKSSRAQAAQTACIHVNDGTPGTGPTAEPSQMRAEAMLAFARCLRTHGFPRFPDPTSGQITHQMLARDGINLHQPAVLQAADACVGVTHGVITKAEVARFIAGQ